MTEAQGREYVENSPEALAFEFQEKVRMVRDEISHRTAELAVRELTLAYEHKLGKRIRFMSKRALQLDENGGVTGVLFGDETEGGPEYTIFGNGFLRGKHAE